ncbi:MAG: serine hydrolase [Mesorhizobium sp.]|nr:serine hydrolase [Mesorhizobium sp.]
MTAPPFSRRDITLANWREWPFNRWTFHNVSEFVPTAQIACGMETGADTPGLGALDGMVLTAADGTKTSPAGHFEASHGDCFVALRDGRIVAEWNAPHGSTVQPHLVFSISKSVTGMMAGIAIADGALDETAPVSRYVPVPSHSAYAEATVRDLLDMTVSLGFEENYLDLEGDFDRYRRATQWNPERPGTRHELMEDVIASLPKAAGPHGKVFAYASPNTDMLGLVIERATGTRFHSFLAERLWKPIGARGPAYVTVDRVGSGRAAGGMCLTARDLARFGECVLKGGRGADGGQIVPAGWVDDMRRNGDRAAWMAGNFAATFPAGRYRSCWYQLGDQRDAFVGDGIHGQRLYIDPIANIVLVKYSSDPLPSDEPGTIADFAMLAQIAQQL